MICPKCSATIQDDSLFCNYCGRKLTKDASPRRGNGTGSVYRRKDRPGWTAQVVDGYDEKGNARYIRKGGFMKKTDAIKALATLKDQPVRQIMPTVSYYYKAFCKGKGAQISADKQKAYEIAFNRLASIHSTPVDQLTVPQLQAIVNDTCKSYYPARDIRVLLNHIFRLAAIEGKANPAIPGLIVLPKLTEQHRDAFTEEEQIMLWDAYEAGKPGAELPIIMIYTGMMTGEMRRLNAQMIDLEAQEITGVGLKTDERRKKSVLIPNAIVPLLADLMEKHPEGPFFPQGDEDFYDLYYNALKAAGITRHLTPYSCRHTTATALAITGQVAPQTVQRIMRWTSTKMMDRYVHPGEQDAREAIRKI